MKLTSGNQKGTIPMKFIIFTLILVICFSLACPAQNSTPIDLWVENITVVSSTSNVSSRNALKPTFWGLRVRKVYELKFMCRGYSLTVEVPSEAAGKSYKIKVQNSWNTPFASLQN